MAHSFGRGHRPQTMLSSLDQLLGFCTSRRSQAATRWSS